MIQVTQLPLIPFFTLPYVRAWAEKYRDQGLVVIGVHTPEFSFEKNADNVRSPGSTVRFRVLIDGKTPGAAHGTDVDEEGNGTITGQRMYQLVRQPSTITDREFEIQFLDAGAAVFDFTFG